MLEDLVKVGDSQLGKRAPGVILSLKETVKGGINWFLEKPNFNQHSEFLRECLPVEAHGRMGEKIDFVAQTEYLRLYDKVRENGGEENGGEIDTRELQTNILKGVIAEVEKKLKNHSMDELGVLKWKKSLDKLVKKQIKLSQHLTS